MPLPSLTGAGTPKGFSADAQRVIAPEQTLERIRPLFRQIGLTRLADVTHLDRIGIPVVLAVRPQSGYLAVDGGKGVTQAAALASAAMECVERHAGELTPIDRFNASYADLPCDQRLDGCHLPFAKNAIFSPRTVESWCWVQDLSNGSPVAVPSVMVSLERHRHRRSSLLPFHFSSNGLNAGNTPIEALVGGLYEVVERDATTCTKLAWEAGAMRLCLNLDTIRNNHICLLVERIRSAGLSVVVLDCTVDTLVPTFCAYLFEANNPLAGLYHGYGTHLDPEVAVLRAVCEAAQSRLVFIAGSRDDSFGHHRRIRHNHVAAHRQLLSIQPNLTLDAHPDASGPTFEQDALTLMAHLARIGAHRVLCADLTHPDVGVPVFRVIVPGLEGYPLENYAPGERGRSAKAAAPMGPLSKKQQGETS